MRKLWYIAGILVVLVLIGFSLGSSSNKFVCGTIIDLANQPIPEIPMMLYKTDNAEDCLYAAISNRKGEFQLRYPGIGTYYLTTILDQEQKVLQKFSIKKEADLVNLRIVYAGSIRETTEVTANTKPKPKPKPAPQVVKKEEKPIPQEVEQPEPIPQAPITALGRLQGTIINSNGTPLSAKTLEIELENCSQNQIDRVTVELSNGEFILTNLTPGKYRFAPIIGDTKAAKKEVEVIVGETSYIEFTLISKKQDTKETANLSVTVIDSSWNPQSSVNIVVECLDAGTRYENVTDENGEVIFSNIEAGECMISATIMTVTGSFDLRETMVLKPGKFSGTVLRPDQP